MISPLSLKSERGSSVVEFLVCAPILALLTYAAYDLNRRIENQQTVTIAARNTVMLGEAFSSSQLQQNVKDQLGVEGQILDSTEKSQVQGGGLHVSVDAGRKLGDPGVSYDRIKDAAGFNTSGGSGAGSSFDTMSQKTGQIGSTLAQTLQGIQTAGEAIGVFIPDRIRSAGVETKATGSANGIQSTIAVLAKGATNDPNAESQVLAVGRRFGQRFYLRQESGYHPNGHDSFDFVGVAVGAINGGAWGGTPDFSDNAGEIQSRCMTRLTSSNACGSGGSRKFYGEVKKLASIKLAIASTLRGLEKVPFPPVAAAARIAITAIQAVSGAAVMAGDAMLIAVGALNTINSLLDKGVSGFGNVSPDLSNSQFVDQFVQGMDPGSIKKMGE